MMLPPRSGTGGMGAGGQGGERRAYMPEDEGYWGAGPGLPGPADRPGPDEPDFDLPRVIVGIGAEADHTASQEATSNWRMR
jgi:beta-glucanase (GH16 family)